MPAQGSSPHDMMASLDASMLERTGRTTGDWIALISAEGPDPLDQTAVRRWLKETHGLKQNTQWALADAAARAAGWVRPTVDGYVDALFSGKKAALRPLYDRVAALIEELGEDVEPQGRGTYVPFVRRSQFAAVAPGPRGTLRVGFRYRADIPDDARLEPAKGFAQATHWVHLSPDEDPAFLESLLRVAYEQNG